MLSFHSRALAACGATVVLAVATAMAAPPAQAAITTDQTRTVVSYRDLDLAQPAGLRTLKRRVDHAVERVCGPAPRLAVAEHQAYWTCLTAARADALAQVRRAELAALQGRAVTTAER